MSAPKYTESQRQKAADLLVRREVHACVSSMVSELILAHTENPELGFDPCEVEGMYYRQCPECGGSMQDAGDESWLCEDCKHRQAEEPELEAREVYEWWIVDPFLANNLEERGEVILRNYGSPIWGRCCTGQSIALDGVIQGIALEMTWIREEVTKDTKEARC